MPALPLPLCAPVPQFPLLASKLVAVEPSTLRAFWGAQVRGLCLSLPRLATSREPPPGPAQPRGLTEQEAEVGTSHGGAKRRASGLAAGGGGLLGWAFMHRAWAAPSPELSSPLESNRKVPKKQPQGAARARARNKRDPSRARVPDTRPSDRRPAGCRAGRRRRGVPGQSLRKELGGAPTGATPRVPERTPFPIVGLYPHPSFPGGKLRLIEVRGQIRIRRGQRTLLECQAGKEKCQG